MAITGRSTRRVDKYNRVSIPTRFLNFLEIDTETDLEVTLDSSNKITIKKAKIQATKKENK